MAANEIVARKHWIAYFKVLLGYGIWLLILVVIAGILMSQTSDIQVTGAYTENLVLQIGLWIVGIVFAISAFFAFASWMGLKKFTWTAEEERLVLRSGWLPWAKTDFGISYDTIFESYVTYGFFSKLFGYRTCVIRRTEGVTSASTATYMTNAEPVSRAINERIKEVRASRYVVPQMISQAPSADAGKSPTEQLKELAALKTDGIITAEEFDLMKRKIIQG